MPTPTTPITHYFPVDPPPFKPSPGLFRLDRDFGNGPADQQLTHLDQDFWRYRNNKLNARQERLSKYVAHHHLSDETQSATCKRLIQIFTTEHPDWFTHEGDINTTCQLTCHLTEETLTFVNGHLTGTTPEVTPAYIHGIDALVSQIQEDLAIVQRDGPNDWLAALHLCAPGHWAAEDKIGLDFALVHQPVPGIESIVKAQTSMVRAMIDKSPLVRFVWGFGSDNRLNHHPQPPPEWDAVDWKGRRLLEGQGDEPPFYLRIERQTMQGLPEVNASLFFIHVYHLSGKDILANQEQRKKLREAITTMDHLTLVYKGLAESKDQLLNLLESK